VRQIEVISLLILLSVLTFMGHYHGWTYQYTYFVCAINHSVSITQDVGGSRIVVQKNPKKLDRNDVSYKANPRSRFRKLLSLAVRKQLPHRQKAV
jgi:hypothetical protein